MAISLLGFPPRHLLLGMIHDSQVATSSAAKMQRMWIETIAAQGVKGSQRECALVMDRQGNQDILRLESLENLVLTCADCHGIFVSTLLPKYGL